MSGSMTRRGVLTGAAAIAGVTALPRFRNAAAGVAAPAAGRTAIGHVVVDERLAHSAAFAGGFDGSSIHLVNAVDDLCQRWYTQLRRVMLADAGHIAGLTGWMDYLVMRGCAAEIGYASAFHADHPPGTMELSRAQAMGEALASGAHLSSGFMHGQVSGAVTAAVAPGPVHMVSWVFRPRLYSSPDLRLAS